MRPRSSQRHKLEKFAGPLAEVVDGRLRCRPEVNATGSLTAD